MDFKRTWENPAIQDIDLGGVMINGDEIVEDTSGLILQSINPVRVKTAADGPIVEYDAYGNVVIR